MFSSFDARIFVHSVFLKTDTKRFDCFYIVYSTYSILFFRIFNSYFPTLFTKKTLSWLIQEPLKPLEIKTSIVFSLVFSKFTILLCLFLSLMTIDLYPLIYSVISQKRENAPSNSKFYTFFFCFWLIRSLCFISSKK